MDIARRAAFAVASLSLVALAAGARPAAAQDVTPGATTVASGPTMSNAVAGVRQLEAAPALLPQVVERRRHSRDVVLMVVGGAGIIVGSIAGDEAGTIITVAGAVLLLYGLYHFLDH
jgi:hypothetical protein